VNGIEHLEGTLDASGLRIAIVAARFNEAIVRPLVDGATGALLRHGAAAEDLRVIWVPGAWELPVVLDRLAASGTVDALVALGCVVRGETTHFDYVAGEGSGGTASIARRHGIPIGNAVLTTENWDQAMARAGGKLGNKGAEAALAAVETATLLRSL
jgi:6,7-dimethyl-8-ribityllumazine synthase